MKAILSISAAVLLLVAVPNRCFALWEISEVTKAEAMKLGIEVRSNAAGPDAVRVELEFKTDAEFKEFSHVDLRIGDGDKSLVTAALKEDRTKEGRVIVSFAADRSQLDRFRIWIMVPGGRGGVAYEMRMKDFVEVKK